ncbi:CDGSH iron-sulfur domain-containing protein [Streptomyces sp. AM 4-1-1]|uniref:CDGSH iron-sulfur domain-containing protein n=1 Tax=unclassified Streptomyces TaxID=2593676 RepID=UPI0023B9BEA8|nr:CDGSH iron-sulfur domain-containing protein [Streptomyces sp. AM 4-1-1]WEH37158.1 CDGSH iron-sulfur domain-containing protein [Streptomyces sp. AM 4-1-1]
MPNAPDSPRRVFLGAEGPLLVEGPVEVVGADGTVAVSDRFTVAICTCRRSRVPPWCDTSHRRRAGPRTTDAPASPGTGNRSGGAPGDTTEGTTDE